MTRDELFIETDVVKRHITRMMFTDDIEELCELLCATNIITSRVFKENLKRINEQDNLRNEILEEASEIEEDYDVDVADCIRDCSTCKNNVECPPPHTCDICTSLDQEEEYEMWEPKE